MSINQRYYLAQNYLFTNNIYHCFAKDFAYGNFKTANKHKTVAFNMDRFCIILRAVNPLCIVRLSCRKGKAMSHFRLGWMGMTFRQYTSSSNLYAQKDTHNLTEFCCPLWHDCQTKSRSENCQKMCACVNWCSLLRMFPF